GAPRRLEFRQNTLQVEVFEDNVPPRFRIKAEIGALPEASDLSIETVRPGGARQLFPMEQRAGYLESRDEIPEPHDFVARVRLMRSDELEILELKFEEHDHGHGAHHRDHNMRAAVVHVMADAAVSVLVIVGLLLARAFDWLGVDPPAWLHGAPLT